MRPRFDVLEAGPFFCYGSIPGGKTVYKDIVRTKK